MEQVNLQIGTYEHFEDLAEPQKRDNSTTALPILSLYLGIMLVLEVSLITWEKKIEKLRGR